jgi:hypothetical protein
VDTEGEDHIYDECRYVCMENPVAPPLVRGGGAVDPMDPLLLGGQIMYAPYAGRKKERMV